MKIYKIGLMALLLATTAIPVEAREKPWFHIDKGCGTRCSPVPPRPTSKFPPSTYATIITVHRTVWYEKNGRVIPREGSAYTHYVPETRTYYEPLQGGALRIPPGGQTPTGYYMAPAEDLMEGSGWIAVPDGGPAPGSKLVTFVSIRWTASPDESAELLGPEQDQVRVQWFHLRVADVSETA